jgi:peptidyl-prolyl cis-trans isomerase B (cyclophilin B)
MMRKPFPALALVLAALVALAVACSGNDDGSGDSSGQEGPTVSFSEACQKTGEKQFSDAPSQIIDTNKTYVATISTAKGDIVVELDSGVVVTTNNFVFLACKGFYDGLIFHRVEPAFVIQGGDPQGTGMGGPGYTIPGEFDGARFERGVIGMARSQDPDSGGSQFYIVTGQASHLDGKYASFGHVTSGIEVADQIAIGDAINSITIAEQ